MDFALSVELFLKFNSAIWYFYVTVFKTNNMGCMQFERTRT